MFGIIKRMLLDKKNAVLAYSVAVVAFLEMYLALFPSIQSQAEQLNQLLQSYPDSFFKAFGMDRADLTFSRVEPYLSTEIFGFIWPILVVILMTSLANYAIVGEIGKGTIELTLAQPISRIKLFFSRYLAGVINLLIFTFFSTFAIIPLAALHNIDYELGNFLKIGLVGFLFAISIFSIAMFFSSIFSERGRASFATGGVLILMYVLNVVSSLRESLENLKYLSFFHYFNPGSVLGKGEIVEYTFLVFLGVTLVFTVLGAWVFNKRDIAV